MLRRIGQAFPPSLLSLPPPPPSISVKTSLPCPTIVHCRCASLYINLWFLRSAGIGRTGTFCAIHIGFEKLYQFLRETGVPPKPDAESALLALKQIDMCATVKKLRAQRAGMVQQLVSFGLVPLPHLLRNSTVSVIMQYKTRLLNLGLFLTIYTKS